MGCQVSPLRDFIGHAIPGAIFIVISLIILNGIFRRYFLCLRESHFDPTNGRRFRSSLFYPLAVAPHIPLVAIICTICSTLGFVMELVQYKPNCHRLHVMLYISFLVIGLFDILRFYKFPIPEGTELLMSLLAMVVNVVLLMQHLVESPMINRFHMNVILIQVGVSFFIVAEMANRHSALLSIAKMVMMTLLGSWYITLGLIINKFVLPDLENDHHVSVRIQLIFVIQIYVVILLVVIVGATIIKFLNSEEVTEMANQHSAQLSIPKMVLMTLLGSWYITLGLIVNHFVLPDLENDQHVLVRVQLIFVIQIYVVILLVVIIGSYQNTKIKLLSSEEVTIALDLDFGGELTKCGDGGKMKYSNDCKKHVLHSRLSEETG